jgi:hypothetical protein
VSTVSEVLSPVQPGVYPPEFDDLLEAAPPEADRSWWAGENAEQSQTPAPAEPMLPFAEWVGVEAAYYRSLGTDAGDWLSARLDRLAETARYLGAETPDEFDDREALFDAWVAQADGEGGARP